MKTFASSQVDSEAVTAWIEGLPTLALKDHARMGLIEGLGVRQTGLAQEQLKLIEDEALRIDASDVVKGIPPTMRPFLEDWDLSEVQLRAEP